MNNPQSRLQVVAEDRIEPTPGQSQAEGAALQMLMLGLKTLSQRVLVAFSNLFTLLTVASVFYLFAMTPDPTPNQIVMLSLYSVFVIVINLVKRR